MRKIGWAWAIAFLLMVQGCSLFHGGTPLASTPSEPGLSLFANADGRGALTIRINDHRFKSQSLDDATSDVAFDAVVFRLYNTAKLRSPLVKAVAQNADGSGVYQAVFTDLPADGANGYYLSVGLFRNIVAPTNLADAAYQQLPNKVGEGVSSNFSILPGQTANTTVTVNAVGDLGIDSQKFVVDPVTPVLYPSDNQAFVDTRVSVAKDPLADSLWLYVLDASETATQSTVQVLHASWAPMTPTATLSFAVPTTPANYYVCAEARDTSNHVLSRRYRPFTVAAEALVGMDLTGGATRSIDTFGGNFMPAATRLAASWGMAASAVAFAPSGNYFVVADAANYVIYKVASPSLTISVIAGNRTNPATPASYNGLPAREAGIGPVKGLAVDWSDNVYFSTADNRIGVLPGHDGTFFTQAMLAGHAYVIAGTGAAGNYGNVVPGTTATFTSPTGLAYDSVGNGLYISDSGNHCIRWLGVSSGQISTKMGQLGVSGSSADGTGAAAGYLLNPQGIATDATGSLFIAEQGNMRVRMVPFVAGTNYGQAMAASCLYTVAGNGTDGITGDGGTATLANLAPSGLQLDAAGNLYILETSHQRVRRVTPGDDLISTIAGTVDTLGYSGDSGSATSALLCNPGGLAVSSSGEVLIADTGNHVVRRISGSTITTAAGDGATKFGGDGFMVAEAQFNGPVRAACDAQGNLYVVDSLNYRIRKIDAATHLVSTVAGNGLYGHMGDGSGATLARTVPWAVACDGSGNLYLAEDGYVRKVDSGGTITTVAGTGTLGYLGDGSPATSAQLATLRDVAVDSAGNVYVADSGSHVIRRFAPGGIITTVAGSGGVAGNTGDGGLATAALLNAPEGIAFDRAGYLYIADTGNNRVRRVDPSGKIWNFAGNSAGSWGVAGDGGPATSAYLSQPRGLAIGSMGEVYVADTGNGRIREIDGLGIRTVAGNGTNGFSGDGGPGPWAMLNVAYGVAVSPAGSLYILDQLNDRIRRLF